MDDFQFDGFTRNSYKEVTTRAKYCRLVSFRPEKVWSQNTCTSDIALATSQIPDCIQNSAVDFQGLHGMAPNYIQDMLVPSTSKRYAMRSNETCLLRVPKFKHDTFGGRAFMVCGPKTWNSLPQEIRKCDEIEAFKRSLKTHLFVKFVNESSIVVWCEAS